MDEREFRACGRKRRYETRIDAKRAAERSSRRKDAPKIFVYVLRRLAPHASPPKMIQKGMAPFWIIPCRCRQRRACPCEGP